MPELRKDPVVGRWVIISTERAKRPHDFVAPKGVEAQEQGCPFCEGHEDQTPPEITAIRKPHTQTNAPGWDIRVVPSFAPVLRIEGQVDRRGKGMHDVINGLGAHEIIVETPQHLSGFADLEADQIALALRSWVNRMLDLGRDLRFKYVLLFKNHGLIAGASIIRHCRSQAIAMPVNPKRVKEKLIGARRYFEYRERCIFCDLLKQELEQEKRIVQVTDHFVVTAPFASRFPFELCVLPRQHGSDFDAMKEDQIQDLARVLKTTLTKLKVALNDPPYNLIVHTAPFRRPKAGYWRSVDEDFHWHIEIMPRLTRVAGFEWGTGFYINPTPPEESARFLREVGT